MKQIIKMFRHYIYIRAGLAIIYEQINTTSTHVTPNFAKNFGDTAGQNLERKFFKYLS